MPQITQYSLERKVDRLVKEKGLEGAVKHIKSNEGRHPFKKIKPYPRGVYVYLNSDVGGVQVGSKL